MQVLPMQEFLNSYILNQNMMFKMVKEGPPAVAQWGGSYRKKWQTGTSYDFIIQ